MTTNPATASTHDFGSCANLYTAKGKRLDNLGACFSSDGRRIECNHSPDDHKVYARADSGAHPTFEFVKLADWLVTHAGHALTHLGSVVSPKGDADCWYCQKDNKICFDSLT